MNVRLYRRGRGSMLVVVLFVLLVLSALALSLAYRAGLEARRARDAAACVQLRAQAESALAIAAAFLAENTNDFDHPAEAWHSHPPLAAGDWLAEWSGTPAGPPEFEADYEAIDEQGKLHVSYASGEALEKLGLSREQAGSLLDWIDADDDASAGGAENDFYSRRGRPYACKNAPLDSLGELLLIRGFGSRDYLGLDDGPAAWGAGRASSPDEPLALGAIRLLTCVGDGKVNLNTAPLGVLKALPLSDGAAERIDAYRAFDGSDGGELEKHVFKSEEGVRQLQGLAASDAEVLAAVGRYRSEYFRVLAWAAHPRSGLRCRVEALLHVGPRGMEVVEWTTR